MVEDALYDAWRAHVANGADDNGEGEENDDGLTNEDVVTVLNELYDEAGAVGSTWPEKPADARKIQSHADRSGRYVEKVEKDKARRAAALKEKDMNEISGKTKKTKVKVDSDGDEDEKHQIQKHGRRRRLG